MAYGLKAARCDPLNKKFPNGKHFPLYFQLFKYSHIFLWKYDMGVSIFEHLFLYDAHSVNSCNASVLTQHGEIAQILGPYIVKELSKFGW